MAFYQTKPKIVEGVEWREDNFEEVKAFLGPCFIKYDEKHGIIHYSEEPHSILRHSMSIGDIVCDKFGQFVSVDAKAFLKQWREME